MWVYNYSDKLYHYGIKGMKWGIRKKRDKKNDEFKSSKTEGFTLKKGTTIHRVSSIDNEKNEGHAYATFKNKDSVGYVRRSMLFNQKGYDMTMKVTKDLVSPSRKERVDAFIELCQNDKQFLNDLATASSKFRIVKDPKQIEKIEASYRSMSEKQLRTRGYNDLSLQIGFDKTVRDKYFKNLSDKGYNMIIDDQDAQLLSDSPIIIFDRGSSLEVIATNKITREYLKDLKKQGRNN